MAMTSKDAGGGVTVWQRMQASSGATSPGCVKSERAARRLDSPLLSACMPFFGWLVAHHVASVVVAVATAGFSAAVLGQRRPTGSAYAWLLVILFVPYLGIPLYVVFGGRKFRRRANSKSPLPAVVTGDKRAPSALGGIPETAADDVTWLDDGTAAYDAFLQEIRRAERSIALVTFVVGNDATGRSLIDALTERAAAGVRVRLLLDDFLRIHAPKPELRRLEAAGGQVRRFMPLFHLPFRGRGNLRNHRKIAVFDDARAIVGGMNLADEYMGLSPRPAGSPRWRDLSTLVTGPVVRPLAAIFDADWEFACGEAAGEPAPSAAPPGPSAHPLHVVPSGPDSPNDAIYDALLTAIFRAEQRFWVATPYFVPDEPLVRALTVAAHRGIDVRVFVPARSNHLVADLVAGPSLRELAVEGVRVFRYGSMLHAKAMLVDRSLAIVGSANFDMRSLFLDYEVALFFSGAEEVARLDAWFEATRSASVAGPPEAGWARARVESVARLLAPLL
jgi:cardiolipin synthase